MEEIAILAGLHLTSRKAASRGVSQNSTQAAAPSISARDSLEELVSLAATAGARVAEAQIQSRPQADAATLIGSGKVDELKSLMETCRLQLPSPASLGVDLPPNVMTSAAR